jgi:hypothetical protein
MRRWKIDRMRVVGGRMLGLALVIAAGAVALAQTQTPQDGFVPLTDATRENLPATPLVYIAYGFVWVALMAYIFLLWQRVGRVERDLASVNAKLAQRR